MCIRDRYLPGAAGRQPGEGAADFGKSRALKPRLAAAHRGEGGALPLHGPGALQFEAQRPLGRGL